METALITITVPGGMALAGPEAFGEEPATPTMRIGQALGEITTAGVQSGSNEITTKQPHT